MLNLCAKLEMRRIKLVSLQDNIDTSSVVVRFTMQILVSLAKYNSNLILKGCKSGIEASKKRGFRFGRQEDNRMKKPKKEAFIQLFKAGTTIPKIMEITGIRVKQTIYNYLIKDNIQPNRK